MALIDGLSAEQLTTLSAAELIDALGGIADASPIANGFYTQQWAEKVAAMERVPLMIPTPDTWVAPFAFKQPFIINDMKFEIEGDQLTMVPKVVFEVWRNKVDGERLLRAHKSAASKRMGYINIAEVPHY